MPRVGRLWPGAARGARGYASRIDTTAPGGTDSRHQGRGQPDAWPHRFGDEICSAR
jgi:hypothetical protein